MDTIITTSNLKDDYEHVKGNKTALILAAAASWGNCHDVLVPTGIQLMLTPNAMKDRIKNVGLPLFDVESSDSESSNDEYVFDLTGL
jgi:hypothetical protein